MMITSTRRLMAAVMMVVTMTMIAPARAGDASFKTPEGAIAAYIEAVAARDFEAMLAATAVDRMTEGFDFRAYVERLRALTPIAPMPGHDPFFAEINRAGFVAQFARWAQFLAYGLLTEHPVTTGQFAQMTVEEADAFILAVDAGRLAGLTLVDVVLPNAELMESERYIANSEASAQVYGADDQTERLALISIENRTYGLGFTLLRFGGEWRISAQVSPLTGTNSLGVPFPATLEEFAEMVE